MALNFHPLHFAILALLVVATAALGGGRGAIVGGWKPIKNLNDPEVLEIAKFAIEEHNKLGKTLLQFQGVLKGETQVVAGINYKLVISAKDGTAAPHQYEVIVWDKPWEKFRELTSFKQLK